MPPFHLCQPGGGASCGACCGLYNFRDHAHEAVAATLRRQTTYLRDIPRTREAWSAAARALKAKLPASAFPDVRVCPLLGFISGCDSEAAERVGCLAHPSVNGGVDLRDCGVYDARTCASFECPSFIWLTADEARLVRATCPDWYLYGLVITDVELLRATFRQLSSLRGEETTAAHLLGSPAACAALTDLFACKAQNAAQAREGIFGRFVPDANGEPQLRPLDYGALESTAAPEDDVLLCLGFHPGSRAELEQARAQVRDLLRRIVAALSAN